MGLIIELYSQQYMHRPKRVHKGFIGLHLAPELYNGQNDLYEAFVTCEYIAVSIIKSSYPDFL